MSELEICAATFFRNKGKDVVTETEFVMTVSLDYRWMSGEDAKKLIAAMVSSGILERKDGYLRPAREFTSELPVAYRPSKDLVASLGKPPSEKKNVFPEMIVAAEKAGMKKKSFIAACNMLQKDLEIDIEVAGLLVLRDAGADVSGLYETVKETVISK
ncbi:MAG: DUF2240 family protein [Candidatus Methanomethylophilaceae archaeon]|jgi:hypothetical protein